MSDVADKLRGARALLARRGAWKKNVLYSDSGGGMCAVGAFAVAASMAPGKVEHTKYYAALERGIQATDPTFNPHNNFICSWNDRRSRRKREVIAAFDKAIELAEQSA